MPSERDGGKTESPAFAPGFQVSSAKSAVI
jgi:hypothetical protein